MCRNIKTLFNFAPPASEGEIRDAALQYVRKLSGFNTPSSQNIESFERAVETIAAATRILLGELKANSSPKNREEEANKARARAAIRFGAQDAR
jgi:hypothetical protein